MNKSYGVVSSVMFISISTHDALCTSMHFSKFTDLEPQMQFSPKKMNKIQKSISYNL